MLRGVVKEISDIIHIRRNNAPDMYKKVVTIVTQDGQKLFVDLINSRLNILEREEIVEGSVVDVEYLFKGSQKGDRKYNNIFCRDLKKIING